MNKFKQEINFVIPVCVCEVSVFPASSVGSVGLWLDALPVLIKVSWSLVWIRLVLVLLQTLRLLTERLPGCKFRSVSRRCGNRPDLWPRVCLCVQMRTSARTVRYVAAPRVTTRWAVSAACVRQASPSNRWRVAVRTSTSAAHHRTPAPLAAPTLTEDTCAAAHLDTCELDRGQTHTHTHTVKIKQNS